MFNFAIGNQEDSLAEIAKQMRISNSMELLRKLYLVDAISEEDYTDKIKQLLDAT